MKTHDMGSSLHESSREAHCDCQYDYLTLAKAVRMLMA